MQNFRLTLSVDQLNVVYKYISLTACIPVKNMEHKLLVAHMTRLQIRLVARWTYPQKKNRITFTAPEAIAFYLMFHNEDFFDPFELATMNPIITQIHKEFI